MIRKHDFDMELSEKVYEDCKRRIERKQCYTNVFHTISYFPELYRHEGWKVAYGYIKAVQNIYVRHCFIVDSKGRAIDPTIATFDERKFDEHDHISFVTLDVDSYLKKLLKNDGVADLIGMFPTEEKKMSQWARRNNITLCG